jgi:hypothetical protein
MSLEAVIMTGNQFEINLAASSTGCNSVSTVKQAGWSLDGLHAELRVKPGFRARCRTARRGRRQPVKSLILESALGGSLPTAVAYLKPQDDQWAAWLESHPTPVRRRSNPLSEELPADFEAMAARLDSGPLLATDQVHRPSRLRGTGGRARCQLPEYERNLS